MTTWNYRVCRFEEVVEGESLVHYALCEVYYGEDGKPEFMTESPVDFVADTKEELIDLLIKASRDAQALDVFVPPKAWRDKDGSQG